MAYEKGRSDHCCAHRRSALCICTSACGGIAQLLRQLAAVSDDAGTRHAQLHRVEVCLRFGPHSCHSRMQPRRLSDPRLPLVQLHRRCGASRSVGASCRSQGSASSGAGDCRPGSGSAGLRAGADVPSGTVIVSRRVRRYPRAGVCPGYLFSSDQTHEYHRINISSAIFNT